MGDDGKYMGVGDGERAGKKENGDDAGKAVLL
jgi:hypothetical protein